MLPSLDASDPPSWFTEALAQAPERRRIPAAGVQIELLNWGRRGDPGLLFLHGNAAHADWWSFIAPAFAASGYRVAALSWSGMGGSDWREAYDYETYVQEILAAIAVAGLAESGRAPVVAAHSFGGFPALRLAATRPQSLSGLVLIDSFVRPEGVPTAAWASRAMTPAAYPTREAAMRRFVYRPLQAAPLGYINAWIARESVKQTADGDWTWKLDPRLGVKLTRENPRTLLTAVTAPLALIAGAKSALLTPEMIAFMQGLAPALAKVVVPEAGHHIMVDQPLALVAALRGVLAGWAV